MVIPSRLTWCNHFPLPETMIPSWPVLLPYGSSHTVFFLGMFCFVGVWFRLKPSLLPHPLISSIYVNQFRSMFRSRGFGLKPPPVNGNFRTLNGKYSTLWNICGRDLHFRYLKWLLNQQKPTNLETLQEWHRGQLLDALRIPRTFFLTQPWVWCFRKAGSTRWCPPHLFLCCWCSPHSLQFSTRINTIIEIITNQFNQLWIASRFDTNYGPGMQNWAGHLKKKSKKLSMPRVGTWWFCKPGDTDSCMFSPS